MSEKLITLQVIGLIGLLASLVIGIFLTMYLVQRNYSPLRKLLGSIAPQPDQEGDNDRNEFHLLARAIALARQESNQAHDWIEQNKSLLQEHFIRKLIHGTSVSGPSQSDMLAAHGLDFDQKPFVVVLVTVENLSTFEKTKRELRPGEPQKVLQFLISSTLQKYFEASATVVGIEDLGTFVYIVSFLHNTPEPDEIKEHLISLGRELEQSCQLTCSLSCSQLQQGHETLAIAFDEACRTMEYQLVVGNASYGTFADLPEDSPHPARYYYPMAEEIRLMNALKAADRMTAHSIIDQVLAKNPLVASPSGGIGRLLAYDLAATMVKALAEVHQEQDSSSISIDSLHRMSEVRGPESLKPELFSLVDQVCNQAQVRGDTARDQYRTHANRLLTAKIRHHIQGHIDNVGLNISSIADELGFGPTHISRVFRENQDQGLLDFINTVRVNRSKEFLKNRDLTLQEVARANGFQDANAYIRIFKKILGMTPGKYREISQ